MNILYVLNSGQHGGMENHVLDLVVGFVKRSHNVFVWCPKGPMHNSYIQAGAKVFDKKANFAFDPLYIIRLSKFLKQNNIEVVHSHELKSTANMLLAAFLSNTKVRVTHTHTPISEWQINPLVKFLNVLVHSLLVNLFSTTEIALTPSRLNIKHKKERIKKNKLVVIPNGLDLSTFAKVSENKNEFRREMSEAYKFPKDKFIFGLLGRISEEKGHKIMLEAYFHLLTEHPELKETTHLLLAGGGPLEEYIKEEILNLNLTNVTITGRFPEEHKIKLYASFDCSVFPSLAEGFGFVLLESLASGIPTLASNLDVLKEVGKDYVYAFFETGDSTDLAHKLSIVYNNRADLRLKDGTSDYINSYSLKNFTDSYENLYLKLLKEHK